MDLTLTATRDFALPSKQDMPDTYPKGRRCAEHGCITRLSVYNEGPWCWCHASRHAAEVQRAIADVEESRERRANYTGAAARKRDLLVVKLAAEGMAKQDIAARIGLTPSRVSQILKRVRLFCGTCGSEAKPACSTQGCPFHD